MTEEERLLLQQSEILIRAVDSASLGSLKKMDKIVLHVSYRDEVYASILKARQFSKMFYYRGELVGALSSREISPSQLKNMIKKRVDEKELGIYMVALSVLPNYRRLGIATRLVREFEEEIQYFNRENMGMSRISTICLHVNEKSPIAKKFYESMGFTIVELVKDYYKNMESRDSYLMMKEV